MAGDCNSRSDQYLEPRRGPASAWLTFHHLQAEVATAQESRRADGMDGRCEKAQYGSHKDNG